MARSESPRGFALIEVLVVIGIIGVLAALLMPVFLRARASAHQAHCLANIKNVAHATSLYLADYDRYWPSETRAEVVTYFASAPGRGALPGPAGECSQITHANPYLREPLLLEPYLGNRDVWHCPSARQESRAKWIVPTGRDGNWLRWYQKHEREWGKLAGGGLGPCRLAFPPGWGGAVTDSLAPRLLSREAEAATAFSQGIGVNAQLRDLKPSAIADPARHVVCGDDGRQSEFWEMSAVAFPDDCRLSACGLWSGDADCCRGQNLDIAFYERFLSDPDLRRRYTRHGGGSNVGFADGHARWFPAEAIIAGTPPLGSDFQGIDIAWPAAVPDQ